MDYGTWYVCLLLWLFAVCFSYNVFLNFFSESHQPGTNICLAYSHYFRNIFIRHFFKVFVVDKILVVIFKLHKQSIQLFLIFTLDNLCLYMCVNILYSIFKRCFV